MGLEQRECWVCDVCEFPWLKVGDKIPQQCARSSCRSRKWNAKSSTAAREIQGKAKRVSRTGDKKTTHKQRSKTANGRAETENAIATTVSQNPSQPFAEHDARCPCAMCEQKRQKKK